MIGPDELLMAYVDGELPRQQRRSVEAWLRTDETARRDAAMLRTTGTMARLAFEAPLWLTPPARSTVAIAGHPRVGLLQMVRRRCRRRFRLALAAAASGAALILALMLQMRPGELGPEREAGPARAGGQHREQTSSTVHSAPADEQATTAHSERRPQ